MPYSYSTAALITAHTALRNLIDAGTGPGVALVYDDSAGMPADADAAAVGVLLGTVTLDDPCGTVDGETGQLVFGEMVRDDAADAAGTIGYVRIADSDGNAAFDVPAQAGTTAVSGAAVFTTLTVVEGGPIEMHSITVG